MKMSLSDEACLHPVFNQHEPRGMSFIDQFKRWQEKTSVAGSGEETTTNGEAGKMEARQAKGEAGRTIARTVD